MGTAGTLEESSKLLTTDQLRKCSDVQSILSYVLDRSMELSNSGFGNVQLMNWESGFLELDAQRGFQAEFLNFFARVKLEDGTACARALRSRDAIIVEDVMSDPQFAPCRDIMIRAGVRAVQSTPLISSSGALVGILSTHFGVPCRPTDQQMLAMRNASQLVANAIIHLRARTAINIRVPCVCCKNPKWRWRRRRRYYRAHARLGPLDRSRFVFSRGCQCCQSR